MVKDDDGHWYIIPENKLQEFYQWCEDVLIQGYAGTPDWAQEIDGPHKVLIGSYQIRG